MILLAFRARPDYSESKGTIKGTLVQQRRHHSRGQATAEVVIGLVGLTVIFFGLVQIAMLGHQSILALLEARRNADNAMTQDGVTVGDYIRDWSDGPDALRFTADDVPDRSSGGTDVFLGEVQAPLALASLEQKPVLGLQHDITPLISSGNLATAAELRTGTGSATIDVENALRVLLGINASQFKVTETAVMPQIHISDEKLQAP